MAIGLWESGPLFKVGPRGALGRGPHKHREYVNLKKKSYVTNLQEVTQNSYVSDLGL